MSHQHVATRRKTQTVAATDIAAHTAAGKVLTRTAILTAHEHGVVELSRLGAKVVDAGTLSATLATGAGIVQLNASTIGKVAYRLGKAQVFALHNIGEDVAALTAAKAMPHLRGRDNVKGRRLFAMERAAPPKLMASGLELNRFLHDGNQVGRRANLSFSSSLITDAHPLLTQVVANIVNIALDGCDQLVQRIKHARRAQPARKRQ